jgi:hypothetical protein
MAAPQGFIAGQVQGKALSQDVQDKVEAVLRTTLEAELATQRPTVGAVRRPGHGSITHGSVTQM